MTIGVTAATGQLGRLVIEQLLKTQPAESLVAIVRDPQKATDFAERGVTVRQADYEDAAALRTALGGVDRLLLVSGPEVGNRLTQHGRRGCGCRVPCLHECLPCRRQPVASRP
ncbi:NAD(P)H-binding protein [Glaciihabitans sp. UYNi722]|uniref:NAD(P)H-binding protein n=1 Tax=Glaciihabitans sp. UYNi722 TaxID=3156344 RepID=UPI003394499F